MKDRKLSIIAAAFLISGYSIATGFFDIPSASGPTGFMPALISGVLIWIFLICTGLLFLEALLTLPPGASVVSVCTSISGPVLAVLASIAFLLVNYFFISDSWNTASGYIQDFFSFQYKMNIDVSYIYTIFTVFFFLVFFLGTFFTNRVNYIFFVSVLICGTVAFIVGINEVKAPKNFEESWFYIFFALPIILMAYDFQSMLPSLSEGLKQNPKKLVYAVILGSGIPLFFFNLWQWIVISSTTSDELWAAFEIDYFEISKMQLVKAHVIFRVFFYLMSFFAIICSVLTTGMAIFDFWSDAFKVKKENRTFRHSFFICLAIVGPVLLLNIFLHSLFESYPLYFIGFAEVFFIGVLPILLTFRLRYILKAPSIQLVKGGKITLSLLALATFFLIYLEGIQFFRRI